MKSRVFIALVAICAAAIISCKKNDDAPRTDAALTTRFNVVNASSDTLNFYYNGSRVNTLSSIYLLGSTGYISAKVGDNAYQFKKYGSSNVLFTQNIALDSGRVYSVFVTGKQDAPIFQTIDTLKADTNGKATIRFVNASPDAGSLDVLVGDTVNFKTRIYGTSSVFLPVGPGIKRIRIYKTGTATPLSDTTRTITGGRIYTLFSKGLLAGSGAGKFGSGLVVNQ